VSAGPIRPSIGLAALARMVFQGLDIQPLFAQLVERASADPTDAAALMDAATMLLLSGDRENGLAVQAQALEQSRLYRRPAAVSPALRVLALMAPGDTMANTPLDFLLEASDIELLSLYVDAEHPPTSPLPDHDVAFLAVGESEANAPILRALEPILPHWPRPLVNGAPAGIAGLTRDGVSALLEGVDAVIAPSTARLSRELLAEIGAGEEAIERLMPGAAFPIIVRPIGSHAGTGLEKLDAADAIGGYLTARVEDSFYLAPFVDYSGADGLFRKQRIALVEGRPFICHMAISPRWMVHYLNADMLENAANRDEEARFMAAFDEEFARRHAAAFTALHARIGLDYFAIDCAETRDGRLLLFEADVAMIVHAMDPTDLFAYKQAPMKKVMDAFQTLLRCRATGGAAVPIPL
jgi:hypothetical protein